MGMIVVAPLLVVALAVADPSGRSIVPPRISTLVGEAVQSTRQDPRGPVCTCQGDMARVDGIIDRLRAERAAGKLTEERLTHLELVWGAYIGEVVRRAVSYTHLTLPTILRV